MREYGSNINLPSLDNLFSSEQERQEAKLEKIQILPLTELHPFRNHPFQVRDDDEMDKMVDSVKEYGVMTPAIVRPRQDGGYEIVAGPAAPPAPPFYTPAAAMPASGLAWKPCPASCGIWTMIQLLF